MRLISELLTEQAEITIITSPPEQPEQTEQTEQAQEIAEYSSNTIIELLKQSLNIHWQQTTSLTAQAVHLERWGYKKLAAVMKADAAEEHENAAVNIHRLEFFDEDYQPMVVSPPTWARHDIVAMLRYNLNSAKEAAASERATISAARSVGDEITANMMVSLLQGSENGIELYESYLKLIQQIGIDNFLTLQV